MSNSDVTHINEEPNGPLPYLEIEQGNIIIDYSEGPIGQGNFSDVYSGKWMTRTERGKLAVAIKRFRYTKDIANDEDGEENIKKLRVRLQRELKSWKKADSHQNIVPLIGTYQEQYFPALISPYLKDLDIGKFLQKHEDKTQRIRRTLSLHIIQGVDHLHKLNVIHGDLKPANILISRDKDGLPVAQITDFGRARIMGETGFTDGSLNTTPRYTAPEVTMSQGKTNDSLTLQSDVYSLGITVLEILSGIVPYKDVGYVKLVVLAGASMQGNTGLGPKLEQYESKYSMKWVWDLLEKCWIVIGNPLPQRISAEDCLSAYRNKLNLVNHNVSGNLIGGDVALRN